MRMESAVGMVIYLIAAFGGAMLFGRITRYGDYIIMSLHGGSFLIKGALDFPLRIVKAIASAFFPAR